MGKRKRSVLENVLVFILLGIEAWYFYFLPLCEQEKLLWMAGAYFLLLLAYPFSKKQKMNISRREAYLTVYMRWIVLNVAAVCFLFATDTSVQWEEWCIRTVILIGTGGVTLYLMLVIIRLCSGIKQKALIKGLFICGEKDVRYRKSEEAFWKDLQKQKRMIYHMVSANIPLEQLESMIEDYDQIYILDVPAEHRNTIMKLCFKLEKPVYCASKISDIMIQDGYTVKNGDRPFFCCDKYRLDRTEAFIKRLFDLVCSSLALICLIPVFLIIACCIKLEDGGPVIYKQTRCTKDGKEFQIYKFRSMVVNSEPGGAQLATAHDKRITKVGQFLRNTKLDELPQLVNILIGDMSIVGPRPERPELIEQIKQEVPEFELRTYVKAGLTGYAQVQGNYNTSPLDKLKWDLMYINEYSLILDLKIIIMTPFVVFIQNNRED